MEIQLEEKQVIITLQGIQEQKKRSLILLTSQPSSKKLEQLTIR